MNIYFQSKKLRRASSVKQTYKENLMKTMHSINQINNGAVFYYSGFKIETVLDYNKLCELVNEKIDAIFWNIVIGSVCDCRIASMMQLVKSIYRVI